MNTIHCLSVIIDPNIIDILVLIHYNLHYLFINSIITIDSYPDPSHSMNHFQFINHPNNLHFLVQPSIIPTEVYHNPILFITLLIFHYLFPISIQSINILNIHIIPISFQFSHIFYDTHILFHHSILYFLLLSYHILCLFHYSLVITSDFIHLFLHFYYLLVFPYLSFHFVLLFMCIITFY